MKIRFRHGDLKSRKNGLSFNQSKVVWCKCHGPTFEPILEAYSITFVRSLLFSRPFRDLRPWTRKQNRDPTDRIKHKIPYVCVYSCRCISSCKWCGIHLREKRLLSSGQVGLKEMKIDERFRSESINRVIQYSNWKSILSMNESKRWNRLCTQSELRTYVYTYTFYTYKCSISKCVRFVIKSRKRGEILGRVPINCKLRKI